MSRKFPRNQGYFWSLFSLLYIYDYCYLVSYVAQKCRAKEKYVKQMKPTLMKHRYQLTVESCNKLYFKRV